MTGRRTDGPGYQGQRPLPSLWNASTRRRFCTRRWWESPHACGRQSPQRRRHGWEPTGWESSERRRRESSRRETPRASGRWLRSQWRRSSDASLWHSSRLQPRQDAQPSEWRRPWNGERTSAPSRGCSQRQSSQPSRSSFTSSCADGRCTRRRLSPWLEHARRFCPQARRCQPSRSA